MGRVVQENVSYEKEKFLVKVEISYGQTRGLFSMPHDRHTSGWHSLHTYSSFKQSVWAHIKRLRTRCPQMNARLTRKEFFTLGNEMAVGCFMKAFLSKRHKIVRQGTGCPRGIYEIYKWDSVLVTQRNRNHTKINRGARGRRQKSHPRLSWTT